MQELVTPARKIVRKVGFCEGVALLEGTRIRVSDIVVQHEHFGRSPEEITQQFPSVSVADVYSALTYYYEHPEEIRREIAERERFRKELKRNGNDSNSV